MFGLFSNKNNNVCPLDQGMRLWMENSFLWLATQFGQDTILSKKVLKPTPQDFPFRYDGSETSLFKTAEIVAAQMDVNLEEVNLQTYDENIKAFDGGMGHRMFTEVDKDSKEKLAAGLYFGKNKNGKYDIFIEQQNLSQPENLVATLAHEFAHIKILGEKRLDFNDELLTDLTTVVFGLGIFNANASFRFYQGYDGWGHNSVGYLKQQEWGYALALYAFYRQEENPSWTKHLTKNIQSDFKKSEAYILANQDKVFIEEYKGGC
ncbi:MAG: hypothetical protein EOO10_05790 [Chitinophagaceae bacterium]|nr:MAG: hypothetical protein EOO10_05790 [Chitinophagaceae bacterium]